MYSTATVTPLTPPPSMVAMTVIGLTPSTSATVAAKDPSASTVVTIPFTVSVTPGSVVPVTTTIGWSRTEPSSGDATARSGRSS